MFLCAKALLIKKECNAPKTHHGLIQLFSLKYVHEDEFRYNVYKYLANAQSDREDADYSAIDSIGAVLHTRRKMSKFIVIFKLYFNLYTTNL